MPRPEVLPIDKPRPAQAGARRRLETLLETENWPMIRTVVVVGALLLGVGAVMAQQDVAVKQDNLMRAQAKSLYGVILKMVKGEIPYDQAAVDAAIAQLEASVPTIPTVFATNPKEDVVNATYGASQKIWQNKADFDSEGTAGRQGDRGRQGQDQGCRQPEGRLQLDPGQVHRLSRDLPAEAQVTFRSRSPRAQASRATGNMPATPAVRAHLFRAE